MNRICNEAWLHCQGLCYGRVQEGLRPLFEAMTDDYYITRYGNIKSLATELNWLITAFDTLPAAFLIYEGVEEEA